MHEIPLERTFRQLAQAYGHQTAEVRVSLDGAELYHGAVRTMPGPPPSLPNLDLVISNVAWTWTQSVLFSGQRDLEIQTSHSWLLLANTEANVPFIEHDAHKTFGSFYIRKQDGVEYHDPFTDVIINDVPQPQIHRPDQIGQRWWRIPPDSVFTAKININWLRPPGGLGVPDDFPLL
jgi:hypothetical protein